jgi:hypothetical protein
VNAEISLEDAVVGVDDRENAFERARVALRASSATGDRERIARARWGRG